MPKKQTQEYKEKGKLVSNPAPQITTQTMKTHGIRRLCQTIDAARPRVGLREQKGAISWGSLLLSSQGCFIINSLLIVSRNARFSNAPQSHLWDKWDALNVIKSLSAKSRGWGCLEGASRPGQQLSRITASSLVLFLSGAQERLY